MAVPPGIAKLLGVSQLLESVAAPAPAADLTASGTDVLLQQAALLQLQQQAQAAQSAQEAAAAAAVIAGAVAQTAAPQLAGKVKFWNETRGFGFVTIDGVDGDVYVHRTVLQDGISLAVGAVVLLSVEVQASSGRLVATSVTGATGSTGGFDLGGKGCGFDLGGKGGGFDLGGKGCAFDLGGKGCGLDLGGKGCGFDLGGKGGGFDLGGKNGCFDLGGKAAGLCKGVGGPAWGGSAPGTWLPPQTAWVKSWNEDRGFGFVCAESGEDVYVHRTVLRDGQALQLGALVWIEASWNFEKNNWQATICAGATSKADAKIGMKPTAGKEAPVALGVQTGTVKAWIDKGYGFIVPDNGGPDVFVHQDVLTDGLLLMVGAKVIFDLQWDDKREKYLAKACSGATYVKPGPADLASPGFGRVPFALPNSRASPYQTSPAMTTGPAVGIPPAQAVAASIAAGASAGDPLQNLMSESLMRMMASSALPVSNTLPQSRPVEMNVIAALTNPGITIPPPAALEISSTTLPAPGAADMMSGTTMPPPLALGVSSSTATSPPAWDNGTPLPAPGVPELVSSNTMPSPAALDSGAPLLGPGALDTSGTIRSPPAVLETSTTLPALGATDVTGTPISPPVALDGAAATQAPGCLGTTGATIQAPAALEVTGTTLPTAGTLDTGGTSTPASA